MFRIRTMFFLLIIVLCVPVSISSFEQFTIDYKKEPDRRRDFFAKLSKLDCDKADLPLASLLGTGGILALRDYILYLGESQFDKRAKWWELPLTTGKHATLNIKRDGKIIRSISTPVPSLRHILSANRDASNEMPCDDKEYSYFEIAIFLEATLPRWKPLLTDKFEICQAFDAREPIFELTPALNNSEIKGKDKQ